MTTPAVPVYCIVKVAVAVPPLALTSWLVRRSVQLLLGHVSDPDPPDGMDIAMVKLAVSSASAPPKLVTAMLYVVVPEILQAGGHCEAILVGVFVYPKPVSFRIGLGLLKAGVIVALGLSTVKLAEAIRVSRMKPGGAIVS